MALPPNKVFIPESNPQTAPTEDRAKQDADSRSAIADAYRLGWMGQYASVLEQASQPVQNGYEGAQHIPDGYEAYGDAFSRSQSPQQTALIKSQIDENQAIRQRQGARSGWVTFGADAFTGIFDPVNLFPVGGLEANLFRHGLVEGAVKFGLPGAAESVAASTMDPTSTPQEGAFGAGGALLLGGFMGGGAAVMGARATGRSLGRTGGLAKPTELPLPVNAPISSGYGARVRPRTAQGLGSANHPGIDFKTPMGTPVRAGADGKVIAVTDVKTGGGYGISVTLELPNKVTTKVAHLSAADVHVGDTVRKGQIYARSGNTGKSTGPHLHYEVTVNGKRVDPAAHLMMMPGEGGVGEIADGAAVPRGTPDTMIDTVNLFDKMEAPSHVEIDGRGVPVYVGKTDSGAMASFVRGRSASQIAEEEMAAMEREAHPVGEEPPTAPQPVRPASRYDGIGVMPLKDAQAMAEQFARDEGITAARALKKRSAEIMAEMRDHLYGQMTSRAEQAGLGLPQSVMPNAALAARLERRADAAALAGAPDHIVNALYDAADHLTHGENATTEEAKTLMEQRAAYRSKLDGDLADLNHEQGRADPYMTRAQMREAMRSSDPYKDDLPFGLRYGTDGEMFRDHDHLQVDAETILSSFKHKPWTKPTTPGVLPLAEDQFKHPTDWLSFVVNHEVEHTVNPQREGETLADYENRINQRALEELQAGKQPFTPTSSRMEDLAIAPTPLGQLQRLVPDVHAEIHGSIQDLAGDMATMLVRNRTGGASPAGGSVFQRSHRWIAKLYPVRDAIRREYLDLIGVGKEGTRAQVESSILMQRLPFIGAKARGKMTLNEFRAEVSKAVVGFTDVSAQATRAADAFTKVMTEVETDGRNLGLFQSVKGLTRRAEVLETRATMLETRAERLKGDAPEVSMDAMKTADRFRSEAAELRDQASQHVMPHLEERYFPRQWDTEALKADPETALDMLRNAYIRDGHPNPEGAAKAAYETITLDPSGDFAPPGTAAWLKHRSIPVTNKEAFNFIVQDPELLMSVYLRRMGSMIEMTRRYGDPYGLGESDMLKVDLRARGYSPEKTEQALQVWEDMRDRIVGAFHGKDPLSWDNRAARALKNLTALALMGKVITSQVGDIGKTIMVQGLGIRRALTGEGPAGLLGGMMAGLAGDISRFEAGGIAKQAGEALELVTARAMARQIESDSSLIVTRQTGIERWLAAAQTPFFVMNGMTPFTVILKEWAGVVAAHNIIDDARTVAAHIHAGTEPDAKTVTRLAQNGIDRTDAQILASMPTEKGNSGLHLPNVNAWEGERGARARELILGAVNGEVRRSVVTPGPLDRPAIFDGVFHSKKGREEGLQRVAAAQDAVDEAQGMFKQYAGRPEDDVERVAALDRLREAHGELTSARRAVGRSGRIEAPLASLPFQMHAFAVASGSKTLHGLLSGADRNRLGGLVSLIAAGFVATWLKNHSRWDKMGWDEIATNTIDYSGATAWLTDIGKTIDTALDAQVYPGNERDPEGKKYADEIGAFGAAPGMIAGLIEPFVTEGATWDDKAAGIRRALPFNNLIWLNGVINKVQYALDARDDPNADGTPHPAPEDGANEASDAAQTRRTLGRWGVEVPDLRTAPQQPDPVMPETIQQLPQPTKHPVLPGARRKRITKPVLL